MDRSIILFTLLTFCSLRLFGEDKKQTFSAHREVVQVSTDNSYAKLFAHPTYAFFAGVPRARSLGGSVSLSSGNLAASGPWKIGITATVFWVGEPPTAN